MLHWLTLLALFGNTLALGLYDDIDDYHLWRRGGPSVPKTGSSAYNGCKKDILVIWDNSNSIGEGNFKDRIEPFLERLINSDQLNVGEDGTQFGFITFSTEERTKTLLKFGKYKTRKDLIRWLKALNYETLNGVFTYTGEALKLADETFDKTSPKNYRPEIDDVVLMITDGEPRPDGNNNRKALERKVADKHSASLKDGKGVKIVGLAVKTNQDLKKFVPYITEWSSEGSVFTADVSELQHVLDELVDKACSAAGCKCDGTIEVNSFVGPEEQRTALTWPKPTPDCKLVRGPDEQPGSSQFSVGETVLDYFFEIEEGKELPCPVKINVGRCSCPHTETIRRMVQPGRTKVDVNWAKPEPNCPVSNTNNPGTSGSFAVGEHTMRYNFMYSGGERDPFTLECQVKIIVDACSCPAPKTIRRTVQAGRTSVDVTWVEPEPVCKMGRKIDNMRRSGSFPVGEHVRTYKYTINQGLPDSFELQCHVNIVITAKCGESDYDPANQECCCGVVKQKKPGYQCCGSRYFDPRTHECCDQKTAVVESVGNCLKSA